MGGDSMSQSDAPLFEIRNLSKRYAVREGGFISQLLSESRYLKAVDDVSFTIKRGEIVGLAGQSGCGKSTLGEILIQLEKPTDGEIRFQGDDVREFNRIQLKEFRQECQIIFQDPYESLNPRYTVGRSVTEPLIIHDIGNAEERDARMHQALEDAGLTPPENFIDQLPAELSGGQRQRVAIARSLVLDPSFIIADEPVSMLDVSVSTGILNLFKELQADRDLTMIYISHDLGTINYLSDRTMIMYLGNIVESGPTVDVIQDPSHPYTEALLNSVPTMNDEDRKSRRRVKGDIPDSVDIPEGCRFHPKCDYATEECLTEEPTLDPFADAREVACYHPIHSNRDD